MSTHPRLALHIAHVAGTTAEVGRAALADAIVLASIPELAGALTIAQDIIADRAPKHMRRELLERQAARKRAELAALERQIDEVLL